MLLAQLLHVELHLLPRTLVRTSTATFPFQHLEISRMQYSG